MSSIKSVNLLSYNLLTDMNGNCFVGGSYRGLWSLVRHSENDSAVGIFWMIVSAVFHLRTLQVTGYFRSESKSTNSSLRILDSKTNQTIA